MISQFPTQDALDQVELDPRGDDADFGFPVENLRSPRRAGMYAQRGSRDRFSPSGSYALDRNRKGATPSPLAVMLRCSTQFASGSTLRGAAAIGRQARSARVGTSQSHAVSP